MTTAGYCEPWLLWMVRVSQRHLIELAEAIHHRPAVEVDHHLRRLRIDRAHDAEVAVRDLPDTLFCGEDGYLCLGCSCCRSCSRVSPVSWTAGLYPGHPSSPPPSHSGQRADPPRRACGGNRRRHLDELRRSTVGQWLSDRPRQPMVRSPVCRVMWTALGGLGHALPCTIADFWTAVGIAVAIVDRSIDVNGGRLKAGAAVTSAMIM